MIVFHAYILTRVGKCVHKTLISKILVSRTGKVQKQHKPQMMYLKGPNVIERKPNLGGAVVIVW